MAIGQSDGSIILSTKVDTKGIKQGTNSIMAMATKAGAALAAAFSVKKIVDFVKASVDAFAEYEQLVGGVETLFKNSADKVMKYANEAYKTAGMSANEYMANVTSFSASLLSSLEGDTDKAAEVANAALISISDNANKMGTNMESVTMAFQGFAKQQYMLLDNLKLGYGGTKTEMERLLKDAQAITDVEYNIDNLADVYTAIGVIQEKLGIAGTTAKEAATTISGAAGMMKASWQNVLVAISGGGDMDAAIENLANSVDIYFDNILPVIEKAIRGIGLLIEKIAPKLAETVGKAFIAEIPRLITSIYAMIVGAFKGLYQGIVALFKKETNAMLEEQAGKTEETAKNQEKVTENVKETNKELKKTLAGFDDIQILSANTADNTSSVGLDSGLQGIGGDLGGNAPDGSAYVEEIDATLAAIMKTVAISMIAIGLILLFTGHAGWGIGAIVFGLKSESVAVASITQTDPSPEIINSLLMLQGVAVGASVALGIMMIFMGSKGLGVGLIAYGAVELGVTIYEITQFDASPIESTINTIQGVAAGAMLALGFFLLYFKVNMPLAISLIAAGALLVIDEIFDIVEGGVTPEISAWINGIMLILEDAALVIGIILLATGVNIPLGVSLVATGAVALGKEVVVNWDAIVGWVKGAWEAVKSFWNKYIAPVFTAKFWLDLAKTCGNGLIGGFESAVNGIIWLFEKMINFVVGGLNVFLRGVDAVISAVGNVFGQDWGVATIPEAKLGRVSIPRLAQGAVIPPNREFLAVLGDQKRGTNIEAPLDTIVEAMNIALQNNGGGQTIKEEHYYLGETELMSIIYKLVKGGERLQGNSLISSGGVY